MEAAATTAGAAAVAAIVSGALFPTAFLGIPGGDSGELVAEACQLGVAHPPGYPLFTYFARAAMEVLPASLGSPARRVNLASCGLAVVSALLLYFSIVHALSLLTVEMGRPATAVRKAVIAAAAASAAFLSQDIWLYSIGAEVFSLNNFFVCLLLFVASRYAATLDDLDVEALTTPMTLKEWPLLWFLRRKTSQRAALAGAFVAGLSLCNQHTVILLVAPIAAWVLVTQLPFFSWNLVGKLAVAGLVGLLPYLHLPLAHTFWRGPGSWGDASTLAGFLRHFLRSDYGTFRLFSRSDIVTEGFAARTMAYIKDMATIQMPGWCAVLVACGAALAVWTLARSTLRARTAALAAGTEAKLLAGAAPGETAAEAKLAATARARIANAAAGARSYPALLVAAYIFYFLVFHSLSNMPLTDPLLYGVHVRFWLQPNLLAFALAALGMAAVAAGVEAGISNIKASASAAPPSGAGAGARKAAAAAAKLAAGGGKKGGAAAAAASGAATSATGSSATELEPAAPTGEAPKHSPLASLRGLLSVSSGVTLALVVVGGTVVSSQFARNAGPLDNSTNDIMNRYGTALLAPLPENAILITGYDHQWTSVRYLQTCERVRPDLSLFNAPMMSFAWFKAGRSSYPRVAFPGTFLTQHMSEAHAAGAFSLADFFVANTAPDHGADLVKSYSSNPPHPAFQQREVFAAKAADGAGPANGGLFFTGSFIFSKDEAHGTQFDLQPFGIVSRVVPRFSGAYVTDWRQITPGWAERAEPLGTPSGTRSSEVAAAARAWMHVTSVFNGTDELVPLAKYSDATWEHAARLDFWNQAVAYGTWFLEWAVQSPDAPPSVASRGSPPPPSEDGINVPAALTAARVLEEALKHKLADGVTVPSNLYKNLGLAYVRIVRSKQALPTHVPWPRLPVFEAAGVPQASVTEPHFRNAASSRVLDMWGTYVSFPEAEEDPGFQSILSVVEVLRQAEARAEARQRKEAAAAAAAASSPRKSRINA